MGFSLCHIDLIYTTPLGAFIDMEPFIVDGSLLSDIIRCYARGDQFMIVEKLIRFNTEKVALMVGLPCHAMKI